MYDPLLRISLPLFYKVAHIHAWSHAHLNKYAQFHLNRGVAWLKAEIHWSIFPSFKGNLPLVTFSLPNDYFLCWCSFGVTFLPVMFGELCLFCRARSRAFSKSWQLAFLHTFPEISIIGLTLFKGRTQVCMW